MNYGPWHGRSLAFISRMTLTEKRWLNADEARKDALRSQALQKGSPPMGAIAWYESPPHGNVALSVGNGEVLGVDRNGWPKVFSYAHTTLGRYLGWTAVLDAEKAA